VLPLSNTDSLFISHTCPSPPLPPPPPPKKNNHKKNNNKHHVLRNFRVQVWDFGQGVDSSLSCEERLIGDLEGHGSEIQCMDLHVGRGYVVSGDIVSRDMSLYPPCVHNLLLLAGCFR